MEALEDADYKMIHFHVGFSEKCELMLTNQQSMALTCLDNGIAVVEFDGDADEKLIVKKAKRRIGFQ